MITPIEVQARRLAKYGIDTDLIEDLNHYKTMCRKKVIEIRQQKESIKGLNETYKSETLTLRSRGFSLRPKEIMRK